MTDKPHAGASGRPPASPQLQTVPTGVARMCPHQPPCPLPNGPDREAARVIAEHPEQGWSLLCNGVVLFDDTGELLPDGVVIPPHRPTDVRRRTPAA